MLFAFLLSKNNTTLSPGSPSQQFNNLQQTALLMSLVQYDKVLSKFGQQQLVIVNYAIRMNNNGFMVPFIRENERLT